ncbi:mesogenin-1 [Hoplias malabaricus]|uniref:mesogenin-1 n=1 Tax=Hoplias malabaricus TaxID=27720 RepID=UPI003461F6A3
MSAMSGLSGELVQVDVELMTARLLSEWDWRSLAESPRLASPAHPPSSPDSSPCSSRASPEPQLADLENSGFLYNHSPLNGGTRDGQRKHNKPKMSSKRRMKASEREKLRMRSLAEALHQLRDYLPPGYSRKGQPLTKIQTLKYTIEYIKELSDILRQD